MSPLVANRMLAKPRHDAAQARRSRAAAGATKPEATTAEPPRLRGGGQRPGVGGVGGSTFCVVTCGAAAGLLQQTAAARKPRHRRPGPWMARPPPGRRPAAGHGSPASRKRNTACRQDGGRPHRAEPRGMVWCGEKLQAAPLGLAAYSPAGEAGSARRQICGAVSMSVPPAAATRCGRSWVGASTPPATKCGVVRNWPASPPLVALSWPLSCPLAAPKRDCTPSCGATRAPGVRISRCSRSRLKQED